MSPTGVSIHKATLHSLPVSAVMTTTVNTCSTNDKVSDVASTMVARNIRHVPVVEEGRLIGMVSIRDVLNFRVDDLQQQTSMLRAFASDTDRVPQDRECGSSSLCRSASATVTNTFMRRSKPPVSGGP